MGPIFNEKIAEKWNLWVREQYTMCTDWLKKVRKVKLWGYCSLNSAWTVAASLTQEEKKKKKKEKRKHRRGFSAQSKHNLNVKGSLTELNKPGGLFNQLYFFLQILKNQQKLWIQRVT